MSGRGSINSYLTKVPYFLNIVTVTKGLSKNYSHVARTNINLVENNSINLLIVTKLII